MAVVEQEKIGKFILQLRKERNLTQKELAEKIGVTDRAISKWENGRGMPELSLIKPLCDELDISVNELLSGERIAKDEYQEKLEENILNTIAYANEKAEREHRVCMYIIIVGLLVIFIAMGVGGWMMYDKWVFPEATPIKQISVERIESVHVSDHEENEIIINETELELMITYINNAEPTRYWSVNDYPRVRPYYEFEIAIEGEERELRYFIYEEDGAVYVEMLYNGVWEMDKGAIYILEQ